MARLIQLELLTDFFNKIGQKRSLEHQWQSGPLIIPATPPSAFPLRIWLYLQADEEGSNA